MGNFIYPIWNPQILFAKGSVMGDIGAFDLFPVFRIDDSINRETGR
jgi:hypothetical protein